MALRPPGEPLAGGALPIGLVDRVALGLSPGSEPCRLHANWLVMLLPFVEQNPLYQKYDSLVPVSAPENAEVRGTAVRSKSASWWSSRFDARRLRSFRQRYREPRHLAQNAQT